VDIRAVSPCVGHKHNGYTSKFGGLIVYKVRRGNGSFGPNQFGVIDLNILLKDPSYSYLPEQVAQHFGMEIREFKTGDQYDISKFKREHKALLKVIVMQNVHVAGIVMGDTRYSVGEPTIAIRGHVDLSVPSAFTSKLVPFNTQLVVRLPETESENNKCRRWWTAECARMNMDEDKDASTCDIEHLVVPLIASVVEPLMDITEKLCNDARSKHDGVYCKLSKMKDLYNTKTVDADAMILRDSDKHSPTLDTIKRAYHKQVQFSDLSTSHIRVKFGIVTVSTTTEHMRDINRFCAIIS
jgi:hypothetical protein